MTRTLAILPAALRDAANAAIAGSQAFTAATAQEFNVPLYAAADEVQDTPTHYWLSHPFTPEQRVAVSQLAAAFPGSMVFDYEDPMFPHEKLVELGLATKKAPEMLP